MSHAEPAVLDRPWNDCVRGSPLRDGRRRAVRHHIHVLVTGYPVCVAMRTLVGWRLLRRHLKRPLDATTGRAILETARGW